MLKRPRSRSPPPWQRPPKSPRHNNSADMNAPPDDRPSRYAGGRGHDNFGRQRARRNQAHEDAHMRQWVSQEDDFVLQQSTKKAKIRVREGRAKPVDLLAVGLGVLDPTADILEEDSARPDFEIMDPTAVITGLESEQLRELVKDIETYLVLERRRQNRTFWKAAKTICKDRLERSQAQSRAGRGLNSVLADIEKVLEPKSLDELIALEKTVKQKLNSNEPIDEEYWEQLLSSIGVFKAKAELHATFMLIRSALLEAIKVENTAEAERAQRRLRAAAGGNSARQPVARPTAPEAAPLLNIAMEDKNLRVFDEEDFLAKIAMDRKRAWHSVLSSSRHQASGSKHATKSAEISSKIDGQAPSSNMDHSQATKALYDREAARGVQEDEEVFTAEEDVATASQPQWSSTYRPRKPRYFNRVQMGYEWNKYNQTHYDQDNPPPKVVQGYKFNIFYPELIDKSKAPTYRIERENGRKRGQTFAPAGEEDTCLIRFVSGPPYEDIAFRIVDREWDHSAKRERGFKSSFDRGILQLHFHFKKIYYRK